MIHVIFKKKKNEIKSVINIYYSKNLSKVDVKINDYYFCQCF